MEAWRHAAVYPLVTQASTETVGVVAAPRRRSSMSIGECQEMLEEGIAQLLVARRQ